ncbi:hypothetical protein RYX36_004568 [Vicia faba]
MQRYQAGSCTSAVNNSSIGGPSARDLGRIDSSSLPTNFPPSLIDFATTLFQSTSKTYNFHQFRKLRITNPIHCQLPPIRCLTISDRHCISSRVNLRLTTGNQRLAPLCFPSYFPFSNNTSSKPLTNRIFISDFAISISNLLPPHKLPPSILLQSASTTIRSASDFNKFRHRPPLLPRLISQLPHSDVCLASSG